MSTYLTSRPEHALQDSPAPARPARAPVGPRVWAGAVIVAGGLGLIVLGGCFLMGVLELVRPTIHPGVHEEASSAVSSLVIVLYAMAFLCFLGAALLLAIGLWGLTRILREKLDPPASDS